MSYFIIVFTGKYGTRWMIVSQDEAKGLYWMYKINGEMAPKGAAETTVKKGDKIEFYQEVYK